MSLITFDNTLKSVQVVNLPEGVTVADYTNNSKVYAGDYLASVTFNYNEPVLVDLEWDIDKAQAAITAELVQEYVYDGNVKNVIASLNHAETSLSYDPQAGYAQAGTYTITVFAAETSNYLSASVDISLVIDKADYDMSSAEWDYAEPFTMFYW